MSSEMSVSQNMSVGVLAAFVEGVILQPTLYWKNARALALPFTANPAVIYRGTGTSILNECQVGQLKYARYFGHDIFSTPLPLASPLCSRWWVSNLVRRAMPMRYSRDMAHHLSQENKRTWHALSLGAWCQLLLAAHWSSWWSNSKGEVIRYHLYFIILQLAFNRFDLPVAFFH